MHSLFRRGPLLREHARSQAALRVAQMAEQSQVFLAHFEHRVRLTLPAAFSDASEETATWMSGVLPEPKYQAFRHDQLVASFHPGHRAKWTAHELCHSLVGFGYHARATPLFHALAAWLAELLPVTLWYFFDEVSVRRCTNHQYGGPIFQSSCRACEIAALSPARTRLTREDRQRQADGLKFFERELAAIARSRKLGRPRGNVHASIDLASDGLAYASAHQRRLAAPEMERFVASFFDPQQGHHDSLDALEARVEEVCAGLVGKRRVQPWQATRWDFAAQDVGYRLLTVRAGVRGLEGELDGIIDRLAQQRTRAGMVKAIRDYSALWTANTRVRTRVGLVAPEALFAVGYELPGEHGSSLAQLAEGIASACPNTWSAFSPAERARLVRDFARTDAQERLPIGRRFAQFLARQADGGLAELASVEAAITHVAPRDPFAAQLGAESQDERVELASGFEVVRVHHDVLGLPARQLARKTRRGEARALLIGRADGSEVDVLELDVSAADALVQATQAGSGIAASALGLDDATVQALLQAGVLVPTRYAEVR